MLALMQVDPRTGGWCADMLGTSSHTSDELREYLRFAAAFQASRPGRQFFAVLPDE